jgi:hypothetical protein
VEKNMKNFVMAFLLIGCSAQSVHAFEMETVAAWFSPLKKAAPLVVPGFVAGFVVQNKVQKHKLYAHAGAWLVSGYITDCACEEYFKPSGSYVNDYKYSTDTAWAASFYMYGLGMLSGSLWKAYWFKKA